MVSALVRKCSVTSLTVIRYGRGQGEWEQDLIGGVGVDRGARDRVESEKLIDGLVGDGFGWLTALAEADECGGNGAIVISGQSDAAPCAGLGQTTSSISAGMPRSSSRSSARSRIRRGISSRRLETPAIPRMICKEPRSVRWNGCGLAGSIQASSRPPPRG